nr:MAG TPA: hypothetical protein [Caudoviricetes sp.]
MRKPRFKRQARNNQSRRIWFMLERLRRENKL